MNRGLGLAIVALSGLVAADLYGADFNGDGKQDIVWRLPSGNPLVWQMNGLSIAAQQTLPTALDAGSAIAGVGRFFGATASDGILWVDSAHNAKLWQINNGGVAQTCAIASGLNSNRNFLGIGDINGDGTDDVLWRNASSGAVTAFLLDGCNAPTVVVLGSAAASLKFVGAGDTDGHGNADLVWRDAGGNVVLWQIVDAGGSVTPITIPTYAYVSWQIAAVADFDGDGKADILWRDPSSNKLALWTMNGASFHPSAVSAATGSTFAAADTIFQNGFDTSRPAAPALTSDWTILSAADFTGDGRADLLLIDSAGDTAIWQMDGATVIATAKFAPHVDMPLPGLTGWRLPLDHPTVTLVNKQASVVWKDLPGSAIYTAYASATHEPAATGVAISGPSPLLFGRNDSGYSDKRYFSVTAAYHGMQLPPSHEAYLVEFSLTTLPYRGSVAIADVDRDGCVDILGSLGNCEGDFARFSEADMGLDALRAPGRAYRDLHFADLDGDGFDDAIANTYCHLTESCYPASQALFFHGKGDGTFVQQPLRDPDNNPLAIGGNGETIVVADFNNDGFLDVFLPFYTDHDSSEHAWLLLNDGHGRFVDVSDAAGTAMRNISGCAHTEGAQALDLNGDGWIDLYAGGHLFLNQGIDQNGIPHFENVGWEFDLACDRTPSPWGLGYYGEDEGAKFIDLDNSGQLSLATNQVSAKNTTNGIRIQKFDGVGHFYPQAVIPSLYMDGSWGLNATDVDGDGLSDLIIAGGCGDTAHFGNPYCYLWGYPHALPQLLVNRGPQFAKVDFYDDGLTPTTRGLGAMVSFADFDYSGTMDLVSHYLDTRTPYGGNFDILMNKAQSFDTIIVTIADANGAHNQTGRVVRVTPHARPNVTMTQVVDGGSGYMSNGPYELTFATPYPGAYTVAARFATATYTTVAHTGDHVTMYANGTFSIQ